MTTPRARTAAWVAMTVLALLTVLFSARYLTLDPDTFLEEQRAVYLANLVPLVVHVGGGLVALTLGPWQFRTALRRRPRLHRVLGRVYVLAVLVTGVSGLVLAPKALVGPIAPMGFAVLGVLLLVASVRAFTAIRRGAVLEHRVWMIRSYALIFAAATLRVWLPVTGLIGVPFEQSYAAVGWTCWLINLVVAEWLVGRVRLRDARDRAPGRHAATSGGPGGVAAVPAVAADPRTG
ncbi:DUF2306 domain-containing protein [Kitasatospora sp. NPDC054939]